MSIKEMIEKSNLKIDKEKILYNEPMKKYTTFKVGGPAECLIKISSKKDLKEILKFANENNIQITVLGNGSNVLVQDKGIKGITLIIKIEKIEIENQAENLNNNKSKNKEENSGNNNTKVKIKLGAGEKIAKVGIKFSKEGLTGFEEISGIPGTIGGAVRMNAGAHGREMKDVIKTVKCLDYHGNEKTFTNEEMNFGYRTSILKTEKYIVTEVEIELDKGNSEEIKEKMDMYKEKRKNSQPLEYPSAGSTFKRGEDFITAKLIDEAGLKGTKVGDAEVSRKHGGFIINKGNATASDILELVQIIKNKIYEKYQKKIELEVEVLGEE
ncbi:MAG: UDP-N-acetylmuramate dehydrogenase [Clostridiales bacterium]|nr:UDP-N-acetylmuramate dehydrogenase [Clostridiales bacterium]